MQCSHEHLWCKSQRLASHLTCILLRNSQIHHRRHRINTSANKTNIWFVHSTHHKQIYILLKTVHVHKSIPLGFCVPVIAELNSKSIKCRQFQSRDFGQPYMHHWMLSQLTIKPIPTWLLDFKMLQLYIWHSSPISQGSITIVRKVANFLCMKAYDL